MPIRVLRMVASLASVMSVISTPSTKTQPPVGLSSPAMMPSSVDLPEPEGPTMATISPGVMRRLMPRRISMRSPPSGSVLHRPIVSSLNYS